MKISRKKITAATYPNIAIPAPFDKYFMLVSDKEIEDMTGYPAHPSPCEEAEGYNIKFYSYVVPKPEYEDKLADDGFDVIELVTSDWDPNKLMLAYVVGDRIYPFDESDIRMAGISEDSGTPYDRDETAQAIADSLDIDISDAYLIYDWYEAEGSIEDFDDIDSFVEYVEDDIYDMLDACDDEALKQRLLSAIEGCSNITGSVDTGLEYWYYSRHGIGPGTIPSGVQVLDWYEEGYNTWMLLDKMLTTQELNDYELKEQFPPEGVTTHNGTIIEGCSNIIASECKKVSEDDKSIKYVVSSSPYDVDEDLEFIDIDSSKDIDDNDIEEERPDWIVDFDIPDDPDYIAREERKRIARELADEEDYYDRLHEEGEYDVCSSEDIEGASIANYKGYRLQLSPLDGWAVIDNDSIRLKTGLPSEGAAREYVDSIATDINSAEDIEEVEEEQETDFLDQPEQEYSSAETAINGKQGKLPAVFSKANIPDGALVLDYGGGTVESEQVAQAYLDQFNAKEMLYDPFNQTPEHNREVIKEIKANGGADVAVCSNVLNVIKEQEVRLDLLNKIKKLLKSGASAYISVYEGSGKDEGSATQKGKSFQNNRKLSGYLEEVQSVFPDATRRGAVIIAPNTNSSSVAASTDISSIDLDQLKADIVAGCEEYLTGPEGGFSPSGTPKESQWDMNADEVYIVEINPKDDLIEVEVRAELGYSGMIKMSEILDRIIEQYDSNAYFDMVEPGIMDAYIWDTNADDVYGAVDIEAAGPSRSNEDKAFSERDKYLTNPDDLDYSEDDDTPLKMTFKFDVKIQVEENTEWSVIEGDLLDNAEDYIDISGVSEDAIREDLEQLLVWHVPSEPGQYNIKGLASLVYERDFWSSEDKYSFNRNASNITDVSIVSEGKLESSISVESNDKIQAATEEELDDAILNGKPFSLDDFKKYKTPLDPNEITADKVEVGDIINIQDASEVNLGTVVKILAINDPAENWIDYTFRCEVIEDPGKQTIKVGDEVLLHFDGDEGMGYIVPV